MGIGSPGAARHGAS